MMEKEKTTLILLDHGVKGEEDNIKDSIDYYYDMFVNMVTAARPIG